jgi:hypothetical protein
VTAALARSFSGKTTVRFLASLSSCLAHRRALVNSKVAAFAIIEMCEAIPTWFDPAGELSESRVAYLYAQFAVSVARAGKH